MTHWHGAVCVVGPVDVDGCCADQPDYRASGSVPADSTALPADEATL